MKPALFFLAGCLFTAGAGMLAGGRFTNILLLGAALALATVGGAVYLMGLRRLARLLNALAAEAVAVEKSRSQRAGMRSEAKTSKVVSGKDKNSWGWVKPSAKQIKRDMEADEEFLKEEAAGLHLEWMNEEAQGAGEGAVKPESVEDVERAMRNHCSQCGQTYTAYPCGLGHATMRHMRRLILEGVGLSEEIQKSPF